MGLEIREANHEILKTTFPNTIPVVRPLIPRTELPHPEWMAGFTTGEGCFYINIMNSSSHSLGFRVKLMFHLTAAYGGQSSRLVDEQLMRSLVDYLDCGNVFVRSNNTAVDFKITKFLDLYDKVIPFFQKLPIRGVKAKDYSDWVKAAEIINKGDHLTKEGSSKIISIKASMNTGRKFE